MKKITVFTLAALLAVLPPNGRVYVNAADKAVQEADTKQNGKQFVDGDLKYKVTNEKNKTVSFVGLKKDLSKLTIPAKVTVGGKKYKVTAISANAVKGNKKLTSVVIGNNVLSIGKQAFKGCKKLAKITIGKNVTDVDASAFKNIKSGAAISFAGGKSWKSNENTKACTIPSDELKVFDKAMKNFLGVGMEPLVYLGSQVVAGLNHSFLCKVTSVTPNAVARFAVVEIYQSLDGSAKVSAVKDVPVLTENAKKAMASQETMGGGWTANKNAAKGAKLGAAYKNLFKKAEKSVKNIKYTPMLMLARKGGNSAQYAYFCSYDGNVSNTSGKMYAEATSGYAIVTVKLQKDGSAKITDTTIVNMFAK